MQSIFEFVATCNLGETESHQAIWEVFKSFEPVIEKNPGYLEDKILERVCGPERQIIFRISWVDDRETVQVSRGFRAEFNSVLDPCKGGLRFYPSVYLGITKLLGSEQIFKNSLTGLLIGGGRGGSDFNPYGRSDAEAMRFCQSSVTELYRHLGEYTDMPVGDTGVDGREIGHMFGQYRKITNRYGSSVLTGKGLDRGGSLVRIEAVGYGVVVSIQEMLKIRGDASDGEHVTVLGPGNVVTYAIKKVQQLGEKVVTCPDSFDYVMDETGIDIGLLKRVKGVERGRIAGCASHRDNAELGRTGSAWDMAVGVALLCATQNELNGGHAATLIRNGVKAVTEGTNIPATPESVHTFQGTGMLFAPGKAANADGVATLGLEMQQNAMCDSWTFEYIEEYLTGIMYNIHDIRAATAEKYGVLGDYVIGANITGLIKVANAMQTFGLV